jgi:copper chaperone NosL
MISSIPAARADLVPAPQADSTRRGTRLIIYSLVAAAIALCWVSLFKPWWFFRLYAPQYPRGLTLIISLKGVSGDAREVDMLNHYIGMAPLDTAASFERQYSTVGVALLALGLLVIARWAAPAWSWLLAAFGALFPVGFLLDCLYWLHRFGNDLDPRAPLRLPGFTPQMFGNGTIGQFLTFARPELGFWLAVLAVALLTVASVLRARLPRKQPVADRS